MSKKKKLKHTLKHREYCKTRRVEVDRWIKILNDSKDDYSEETFSELMELYLNLKNIWK